MGEGRDGTPTGPTADRANRESALLIIDMIGDEALTGSNAMKHEIARASRTIAALRVAAGAAGVPVIFIDSGTARRSETSHRAANPRPQPAPGDHIVGKPQFSGFHATSLPALLDRLGVARLILTGIATDTSVMFTAADAQMRDLALWVPEDAVAGTNAERNRWALGLMRQSMSAEIRATSALPLAVWLSGNEAAG